MEQRILVKERCYCLRTFSCSENLFSAYCVADTVSAFMDEVGIDFCVLFVVLIVSKPFLYLH